MAMPAGWCLNQMQPAWVAELQRSCQHDRLQESASLEVDGLDARDVLLGKFQAERHCIDDHNLAGASVLATVCC